MKTKVILKEYMVGFGYETKLSFELENFNIEAFKEAFLKRLGNVQASNNKSAVELKSIKDTVKYLSQMEVIIPSINQLDRWHIEVIEG